MLLSAKIMRRQSEIRQALAELAAQDDPSAETLDKMGALDAEYRGNEARYRAALVSEDTERRDAGRELETRAGSEWSALVQRFELRQAALHLDEGRAMDGATAEIVAELRSRGGYRGVPVPWEALEARAGETVASGTPNPVDTRPIIDRLFPASVAARMGATIINIGVGEVEWPVVTGGAVVGWAATETGAVGAASPFATADRPLKPEHTLGVQMKITRKAMKQSGAALEAAIRRDMNSAMAVEIDRSVFLGTGANGQPLGVIAGAATYGITATAVNAVPTYATFRDALVRFMLANAVSAPSQVRVMIRPEIWSALENQAAATAAPMWEWDRLIAAMGAGNVTMSTNALAAPAGDPLASSALLTTTAGGVPPIMIGAWGGIDMVRDVYSDASSGGLRLTALATLDVTTPRAAQLEVLTGLRNL